MEDRYLFKAKTCNGEWVRGFLASNKGKLYISNRDGRPFAFEIRPDTICQCTGLKDKNGKLIWENDLVNCLNEECCGYIGWNESEAGFYFNVLLEDGRVEEEHIYDYQDDVEVIGNKFDNPELSESEENVEKCYCKTTDYLTIRRDVIGYGRSLVVGIDFKKKAITTYYAYACDSGTSKNLNIEYCPLCGEKL